RFGHQPRVPAVHTVEHADRDHAPAPVGRDLVDTSPLAHGGILRPPADAPPNRSRVGGRAGERIGSTAMTDHPAEDGPAPARTGGAAPPQGPAAATTLTPVAQDYLKAIWNAAEWHDAPMSTKLLAERVGAAPSTVSETVRRLAERGLLDHVRYG